MSSSPCVVWPINSGTTKTINANSFFICLTPLSEKIGKACAQK